MSNYHFPHVLNTLNVKAKRDIHLHVVSDTLSIGDNVGDFYMPGLRVVEILETRKAQGDWKGARPNWYKVRIN